MSASATSTMGRAPLSALPWCWPCLLFAAEALAQCPSSAQAHFLVQDLLDGNDTAPGDGHCRNPRGHCNLRAAIEEANALGANFLAPPVCIELEPGTHALSLGGRAEDAARSGDLDVHANVLVYGRGEPATTVIDAGGIDRVLQLHGDPERNPHLELRSLRLVGGHAGETAGGGAVASSAVLTLIDVELIDNVADGPGGAIAIDALARPSLENTLRLRRVRMVGNRAARGGALALRAGVGHPLIAQASELLVDGNAAEVAAVVLDGTVSLHVERCAFTNNASDSGAIALDAVGAFVVLDACTVMRQRGGEVTMRMTGGSVRLSHLTLVDNSARGLEVATADAVVRASILAGNAGGDLALSAPPTPASEHNLVGVPAPGLTPLPGWRVGIDAQLAPPEALGFLSGREPLADSPALDAVRWLPGSPSCAGVDQWGTSRPQQFGLGLLPLEGCDLGAVERRLRLHHSGFETAD